MSRAQSDEATIQWYPGHMVKAMRRIADDMRAIDVVVEVTDARVPGIGTNPVLDRLAGSKPRMLLLSRAQLADPAQTKAWIARYAALGRHAVAIDAKDTGGVKRLRAEVARLAGARKTARAIVIGIPNAGKSTAINALVGRTVARVEDRAGVTRARQWFRMGALEVMDTAGILVPKIDGPEAQWKLGFVGAVPRARFDAEDLVARFVRWAREVELDGVPDLETFARSRGFVNHGDLTDSHNAAWAYLKDWNDGRFGRMTLDRAPAA